MRHDEAHELLPWLHTGSLGAGERRAVEDHVRGCALCASELRRLDVLAVAVGEVGTEEPQPSPDLLARALARLPASSMVRPGWLARARDAWGGIGQPLPPLVRIALAAQLAVILALGAGWYAASRPDLVTLGGSPVVAGGEQTRLLIAFRADAAEGDVQHLLLAIGGKLVGGPSPAGFYTLAVPLAPARGRETDALLARLRQDPTVRYAERAP